MSQNTIHFLNEQYDLEDSCKIMVVLPLHRSDENPQYYAYVKSAHSVLDLKELVKAKLASQPPTTVQRVIYRGRILDNSEGLGPLLAESSEELPHFHIVINNSSIRVPYNGIAHASNTVPAQTSRSSTPDATFEDLSELPPESYEVDFYENTSLPLSQQALRNYMLSIRHGTSTLSNLPTVNHPTYYQLITINGRAYLVMVPPPSGSRQTSSGVHMERGATLHAENRSFYFRVWETARTLWPSIWLAMKLFLFYFFLSNGTSIYKKIFLGAIAVLIFAFQQGIIDIQIEIVRNQPREENIPVFEQAPVPERAEQNDNQSGNFERQSNVPQPQPDSPYYPLLQALRAFFISFFPTREVADNDRAQLN